MSHKFRLDDLFGVTVRDADGRAVGRLYDARLEDRDGALYVAEYHLGSHALLERIGLSALRLIGVHHGTEPTKVPWDRLDVSDPDRPVIR